MLPPSSFASPPKPNKLDIPLDIRADALRCTLLRVFMRLIDGALSLSSCFCVASFCCASSFHSASAGSSSPRETVSVSPESNRGGVRGVSPSSHSLYPPPLPCGYRPSCLPPLAPATRLRPPHVPRERGKGMRQGERGKGNAARRARQGERVHRPRRNSPSSTRRLPRWLRCA